MDGRQKTEPDRRCRGLLGKTRFGVDEANRAGDEWGFNCGPGALCGILNKTPDEIRPHLCDFESKGYTSPTMMRNILNRMGVPYRRLWQAEAGVLRDNMPMALFPDFGLVRIQWDGPWCDAGVPIPARYRATHWIGYSRVGDNVERVFDVNAICVGGWIDFSEWATKLAPWIVENCVPRGNGRWWPTHCWKLWFED